MARPSYLVVAACLATVFPAAALPPVVVERHVLLSVDALLVDGSNKTTRIEALTLELAPGTPEKATLRVPWGDGGGRAAITLRAELTGASEDGVPGVTCWASVALQGDKPRVSERRIEGEATALFEVLEASGRRIVLALRTEPIDRPVVHKLAKVGDPVRFRIAVERVDGDRAVLLETNHLNTFVGQSVTYSFRLGHDASLEDVRLELLPLSVSGDVVTIQAGISGALPGEGATAIVSRQERIVASRLATSTVSATTGSPPSGYRFQVTPDF